MTTSILELLAHQPMTRYELSFLVRRPVNDVSDAIWDRLIPDRLVEVDDANVWSITPMGRQRLAVRRDEARACVGRCG